MANLLLYYSLHFNIFYFRDKSIPAVESVALDEIALNELDALSQMMDEQAHLEQNAILSVTANDKPILDSTSPEPCQDYQAARLVLSHLGLLKMFGPRKFSLEGSAPSMVPLSTDNVDFINDLEKLDRYELFFSVSRGPQRRILFTVAVARPGV